MSRGVSYLAAYRLAKKESQQIAYKQALMEIKDLEARARAYAGVIESLDDQILEYNKLKEKVIAEQDPKVKNEILQAEIALAQVNERNAGNKVAAYRYADERFDAPSRTDSQIANFSGDRSTAYTGNVSTLMNKVKATHTSVFSGLTTEQQQDAAIKLYDAIITEGNAARIGSGLTGYTPVDDTNIRKGLAQMIGKTDFRYVSRSAHRESKEDYIDGVLGEAVGSTRRLRAAIDTASQAGVVTPDTLDTVLTEVAIAAAADGFDDNDQSLLMSGIASLYGPKSAIEFTGADGKKKKILFNDASDEQKELYFEQNKIPSTIDELFARRSIASDPRVIRSKRTGDQLTEIKTEVAGLQARRTRAISQELGAQAKVADRKNPENLRERQAELFGQTLTSREQRKQLTPEQMRRVAGLEAGATTAAEEQMSAKEEELAAARMAESMTPAQINSYRAMAAAVQAQKDEREIELNELQEDVYAAMSEQIKSGNITSQDIYAKAEQLGNQMGGLADSQRDFAQTVASRIYLDMYNDLEASMPAKSKEVLEKEFPEEGSNTVPKRGVKKAFPETGDPTKFDTGF